MNIVLLNEGKLSVNDLIKKGKRGRIKKSTENLLSVKTYATFKKKN